MANGIHKHEYSIGRMLSISWKHFSEDFGLIAAILLVVSIPVNVLIVILGYSQLAYESLTIVLLVQVVLGFAYLISMNALMFLVDDREKGKKSNFKSLMMRGLKKWPESFLICLVLSVFLFVLSLAFIIPGIVFGVFWAFAIPAVVLANKKTFEALKYSYNIVKGRWWLTLGYSIVFGLVAWLASVIVLMVLGLLPDGMVVEAITNILVDVVSGYFIVLSVIFYLNFDSTKKK